MRYEEVRADFFEVGVFARIVFYAGLFLDDLVGKSSGFGSG